MTKATIARGGAAKDEGFVSTRWLEENLAASWLRVVDVRSGAAARDEGSGTRLRAGDDPPRFVELGPGVGWLRAGYWPKREAELPVSFLRGHVPGATSLDVGGRLFDDAGALVWGPELAMAMSELGVGDEHTIVLVDEGCPAAALVAAWALRRYGHGKTRILSGGYPRWVAEGRPVSREITRHPFASFTAKTPS